MGKGVRGKFVTARRKLGIAGLVDHPDLVDVRVRHATRHVIGGAAAAGLDKVGAKLPRSHA